MAFLRQLGVRVELDTLPIGDIAIGDLIVIERKRTPDFLQSLCDGRLLSQASRLMSAAPRPLLVIEGADSVLSRAVHINAVAGLMGSLATEFGLPIVPTTSAQGTARLVAMLARREANKRRRIAKTLAPLLRMSEIERGSGPSATLSAWTKYHGSGGVTNPPDPVQNSTGIGDRRFADEIFTSQQRILEGISGIGPARARELLLRFNSPIGAAEASLEELLGAGLGMALARRVKHLLSGVEVAE